MNILYAIRIDSNASSQVSTKIRERSSGCNIMPLGRPSASRIVNYLHLRRCIHRRSCCAEDSAWNGNLPAPGVGPHVRAAGNSAAHAAGGTGVLTVVAGGSAVDVYVAA